MITVTCRLSFNNVARCLFISLEVLHQFLHSSDILCMIAGLCIADIHFTSYTIPNVA